MTSLYTGFTLILISSIFNLCSVAGDCIVANLQVQQNFDLQKFHGKWYEHYWYKTNPPSAPYSDYKHYYTPTDSGNLTSYISYRKPDTDECEMKHGTLIPGQTPGKLTWLSETGKLRPYWVLDTDYTKYALVYGCYNVSRTGTCLDAMAWVWGRSTELPDSIIPKLQNFYSNICINEEDFLIDPQSNECDVPKVYKMSPDQNCRIDSFSVQELDKDKFAGLWYEAYWITEAQVSSVMTDFMYEFVKLDDSKFAIYVRGRGDKCSYHKYKFEEKSTPGQYNYEGVFMGNDFKYDSWIIETDYTNYAVQFICRGTTDGVCTANGLIVWSRRPSLPPMYKPRVNNVIQRLCLNPTSAFTIKQDNVCPPLEEKVCETNEGMAITPCASMTLALGFLMFILLQ